MEATLGATKAVETAQIRVLDKERRQAGLPSCGSEIQPEVSVATGTSSLSLESAQSRVRHEATGPSWDAGPAEEAKDGPPGSSIELSRLQRQEGPALLPKSSLPWGAEGPAGRADPMKLARQGRREVPEPVLTTEASRGEPGAHGGEALHPSPTLELAEAAAPRPPTSSSPGNPTTPSLPRAGTWATGSPPATTPGLQAVAAAAESPGSDQEAQCRAGPPPKPPTSSPVRRCLSSSAAAISRYLAVSCISQSLAKRNAGPAQEETQVPLRPFPPRGAPGGLLVDPLALLPKAAPRRGGRLGPSLPREASQPLGGSGPPSPSRHRALLATVQAFEPRTCFTSLSEPTSRAQSPSALKPQVCSPPPSLPGPPASSFAPLCPHPPWPLATPVLSPVALRPGCAGVALSSCSPVGSPPPDRGLAESSATNGDCAGWPNVPGLCLRYVSGDSHPSPQRRPPLEGEGHPSPEAPLSGVDVARPTDRSHQRASYSTTVNIQIGGSGRIASFSKAQVSLTHPLLATPEPLGARKVHSSATEMPQNT